MTVRSETECWIASAPLLGDVDEVAHTTDAGRTWAVVSLPRQINAVAFVDPFHGWAAGNAFFHTTDGGATIGGDAFYHTTDGGNTRTKMNVPVATWSYSAHFFDLCMASLSVSTEIFFGPSTAA